MTLNLIDVLEANCTSRDNDLFATKMSSIKLIKKHFKRAQKEGVVLANYDFSSGTYVYVAQKITGYASSNGNRGYWLNRVLSSNKAANRIALSLDNPRDVITLLDPWQFNLSRVCGVEPGTLEPCVDYALIAASDAVIMDYARGVSFGTTCEILSANDSDIPVIGVTKDNLKLSVFTQRHTDAWITDKDIVELVQKYEAEQRGLKPNQFMKSLWFQDIMKNRKNKAKK